MGIKDMEALSKTIKPFRQDICQNSSINTWSNNEVSGSSSAPVDSPLSENQAGNHRQRQRRPDRAVYVPRGRRSQTTPPTAAVPSSENSSKVQVLDKESADVIATSNSTISSNQCSEITEINTQESVIVKKVTNNQHDTTSEQHIQSKATGKEEPQSIVPIATETMTTDTNTKIECSKIENALNSSDKDYNEEKELQRASKEINRRNRRIIKQTFDSDVLEITETPAVTTKQSTSESESTNLQKKPNLPQTEVKSNANSANSTTRAGTSNQKKAVKEKKAADADEDDWESIFDDNGECLDPKVMNEITANVGKVTITKPKNDYKNYQESVNLDGEEFPHVLEVSNFPPEFKTQDLMMIFAEYKDSGYDIKWVDDTHALVVFSSSKVAAQVLNTGHSFVKLKPLTQATVESRARAKKSALFLQPYRQRPETCAALARRLVTGALGVRLSTAREEREIERRVLKEAKERKLLAAKLRDAAWND